jgi:MbtH protein
MTTSPAQAPADDPVRHLVVINDEGQYSILPEKHDLPAGWHFEGTGGTRDECLAHIDRVWTDCDLVAPVNLEQTSG